MMESISDVNTKTEESTSGVGTSVHTYKQVQLIAYHMYTLKPFITRFKYPSVDARMRMRRVFDVMKFCSGELENDQPSTLKIFVAPEFYGRSPLGKYDGTGHYDPGAVWRSFEALRELCRQDKCFQHWLVIPGTFVTAEKIGAGNKIFNSVYAFMGDGSQFRIIHKKYFSEIDELTIGRRGGNKQYKKLPEVSRGTPTKQSTPIQVGNLTIGIEICLDHRFARLRESLEKKKQSSPLKVADGVDVQVLPVCGMQVGNNAAATKDYRYIFRVEGHPDSQLKSSKMYPEVSCLSMKWDNQVMDNNVQQKSFNPRAFGLLSQEYQLNSAYDPSNDSTSSYYFIYEAQPV